MIIFRKGIKDKWTYHDKNGTQIKTPEILEYIKSLVIPPAYKDVQIFYEKNKTPKMLYFGYDDKGRKQQIYSQKWRQEADANKFALLIDFGHKLPQMMLKMMDSITYEGRDPEKRKNKLIAIILRITSLCGFRIGQLKYHKLYNSTGMSTLQKKHIKPVSKGLEIKFVGKKGMLNECIMDDAIIVTELKKLMQDKAPNDFLFTYTVKNGDIVEEKMLNAIEVNNWLKEYNPEFTTKLFRTFDVNERLIESLMALGESPSKLSVTQRKKNIVEIIKNISCTINNTPAICKKSYISPELLNLYINHPKKFTQDIISNSGSVRFKFIKFLEKYYN